MADEVDLANKYRDVILESQIERSKVSIKRLAVTGRCYNCDEPVKGVTFCDVDCRDDYEKRMRLSNDRNF